MCLKPLDFEININLIIKLSKLQTFVIEFQFFFFLIIHQSTITKLTILTLFISILVFTYLLSKKKVEFLLTF